jgi:hypothetical protein
MCLLRTQQTLADDPCSLFSAARTHSRLHQAAVLAASSIRATQLTQKQADSVGLYLETHGRHVDSISLTGLFSNPFATVSITLQLPLLQRLRSLDLKQLGVKLQCGYDAEGVLAVGVPLKLLHVDTCELHYHSAALAAALSALRTLQHLGISRVLHIGSVASETRLYSFPTGALQALQQLTFLELSGGLYKPDHLQHLQKLTHLQDLQLALSYWTDYVITASMLSSLHQLTRLHLNSGWKRFVFEPGALSGMTKLQRLELHNCMPDNAARLQQLTHLVWFQEETKFSCMQRSFAPAAAYSTLTASSRLQHLSISGRTLLTGAWQQLQLLNSCSLPAGSCYVSGSCVSWGILL